MARPTVPRISVAIASLLLGKAPRGDMRPRGVERAFDDPAEAGMGVDDAAGNDDGEVTPARAPGATISRSPGWAMPTGAPPSAATPSSSRASLSPPSA